MANNKTNKPEMLLNYESIYKEIASCDDDLSQVVQGFIDYLDKYYDEMGLNEEQKTRLHLGRNLEAESIAEWMRYHPGH